MNYTLGNKYKLYNYNHKNSYENLPKHWYILGHEGNFNKYPTSYIDMLGQPYDYGSIMHYSAYAFAIDRHKMTIEPKQRGVTIGQRLHLSDIDVKEIKLLYECMTSTGGGSQTSAPHVSTAAPVTTRSPPTSHVAGSMLYWYNNTINH